jgi:hypothetical protein
VVVGCDVALVEWFPTSEENAVPSPSRVKQSKFLEDIRNHSTKAQCHIPEDKPSVNKVLIGKKYQFKSSFCNYTDHTMM